MKVGDLVIAIPTEWTPYPKRTGIIVDMIFKKCWRPGVLGHKIDWDSIDPEPHAVVMWPGSHEPHNVPAAELEVIS
jgi:hypothetical protein